MVHRDESRSGGKFTLMKNLNLPPGRKGWESESVMHSRDVTRSESPAALLL